MADMESYRTGKAPGTPDRSVALPPLPKHWLRGEAARERAMGLALDLSTHAEQEAILANPTAGIPSPLFRRGVAMGVMMDMLGIVDRVVALERFREMEAEARGNQLAARQVDLLVASGLKKIEEE